MITPRFVPSCSPALLQGLGDLARQHGCHVQSHISESLDNDAFVSQLHPEVLLATYPDFRILTKICHPDNVYQGRLSSVVT